MSDSPIRDAIRDVAKNELSIEGSANQKDGKEAHLAFEREKGNVSGGVVAGISDDKGWGVSAFFKWAFGGKK